MSLRLRYALILALKVPARKARSRLRQSLRAAFMSSGRGCWLRRSCGVFALAVAPSSYVRNGAFGLRSSAIIPRTSRRGTKRGALIPAQGKARAPATLSGKAGGSPELMAAPTFALRGSPRGSLFPPATPLRFCPRSCLAHPPRKRPAPRASPAPPRAFSYPVQLPQSYPLRLPQSYHRPRARPRDGFGPTGQRCGHNIAGRGCRPPPLSRRLPLHFLVSFLGRASEPPFPRSLTLPKYVIKHKIICYTTYHFFCITHLFSVSLYMI